MMIIKYGEIRKQMDDDDRCKMNEQMHIYSTLPVLWWLIDAE